MTLYQRTLRTSKSFLDKVFSRWNLDLIDINPHFATLRPEWGREKQHPALIVLSVKGKIPGKALYQRALRTSKNISCKVFPLQCKDLDDLRLHFATLWPRWWQEKHGRFSL